MQTTTALSGGFKYNPTTSRILASNSGSVENLNVCTRQGCSPHLRQIRATVANEIPSSAASSRPDVDRRIDGLERPCPPPATHYTHYTHCSSPS